MEVSDPSAWQLGISHGGDLTYCLYVRDRLNIQPDITPRFAAVTPAIAPTARLSESKIPELEAQWTWWWSNRLQSHFEGEQPHFNEPVLSFPELSGSWELYECVTAIAEDGMNWAKQRNREFFEIFKSTRSHSPSIAELGNRYASAAPFKLELTCLPVDEKNAWDIDPGHAFISYQFYSDWKVFIEWLERRLAS